MFFFFPTGFCLQTDDKTLPGSGLGFFCFGSGFSILTTFLERGLALSGGSPNRFWYELAEIK